MRTIHWKPFGRQNIRDFVHVPQDRILRTLADLRKEPRKFQDVKVVK